MQFFSSLFLSSVLGGTALVPLVDLVTKDVKSPKLTYLIAVVSSVIMGVAVTALQGKFSLSTDPNIYLPALSTVFITSQTIFNLYWRQAALRLKLFKSQPQPTNQPIAETGQNQV